MLPTSLYAKNEVDLFFISFKNDNFNEAKRYAAQSEYGEFLDYYYYLHSLETLDPNAQFNLKKGSMPYANALYYLNSGLHSYLVLGNELKAVKELKKCIQESKKWKNRVIACEAIKLILEIYQRFSSEIGEETHEYFLSEHRAMAYDTMEVNINDLKAMTLQNRFNSNSQSYDAFNIPHLKELSSKITNKQYRYDALIALAIYYQHGENNLHKSIEQINKLLKIEGPEITIFQKERKLSALINLAVFNFKLHNYNDSKDILDHIEIDSKKYILNLLNTYLLYWKFQVYKELNLENQSIEFENESLKFQLLLDQSKQMQLVSEYETKYQTAQKEKQILLEQEEKERNRNIAYGLGGGVVAVSLIGFLLFTNSRRKQRIAEQQREIEIQKTEKILKEQELTTIDAMIAGQEKERQRLASDLHDSVGATLAAAKLQFDHLSKNKGQLNNLDELFDKTGKLLDDAYTEVRSMAHAKNSGVIAKNGLLPAVQNLAKNASGTNELKIDVEDFGLDERLENSLEIAVFRIIQELVTNVIKHAKAKEATISITQHDDMLNIIVEDDGVGFDVKKTLSAQNGMGLSSIERRVEILEGSMEVDATLGKGTTIVIDIPI